jgi:hypothetical protein
MSTIIETNGMTVVNETDNRGRALMNIIDTFIPGFLQIYYGFRPFGQDTIQFPCAMVECSEQRPSMITTAKYECRWTFNIYFFVTEDNPESVVTLQGSAAEALIELFSNSQKKAYPGYWVNSEMKAVLYSTSFINAKPTRQLYMRVGIIRLELIDVILK